MAALKIPGNHPRLRPYSALRQVGKGSYGEVFLVKHAREKKQFVMKNIKLTSSSAKERLAAEQEAALLSQLQHPNIVGYKESFQDEFGVLHIVMAYCEGGDLCTRLKGYRGQLLPEPQVVEWFVQIALALQYLHERNILHRDLKTQNIFLSKNDIIKVGDLGIARVLDGSCDLAHTVIGTPYYMSPELFANQPYNHKSDIWALGCCVYEMATLKHAFTARNINALMYKIVQGKLPPLPGQFSGELSGLVKVMLSQDPDSRPAVNTILRMEFIRQHIKLFLERAAGRKRKKQKPPPPLLPPSLSRVLNSSGRGRPSADPEPHPQTRDVQAPPPDLQKRRRSSASEDSAALQPRNQQQQQQQQRGSKKRNNYGSAAQQQCRSPEEEEEGRPQPSSRERRSRNKPPRPLPPDPVASKEEKSKQQKAQSKSNQPVSSPSAGAVSSARERRRRNKQEGGGGRGRVVLRSRSSSDLNKKESSDQTPPTGSAEDCVDGAANVPDSELTVAGSESKVTGKSDDTLKVSSGERDPVHCDSKSSQSAGAKAEEAPAINGSSDSHSSDEVDEFFTLLDTTLHLPEPSPRQQDPAQQGVPPAARAAFTLAEDAQSSTTTSSSSSSSSSSRHTSTGAENEPAAVVILPSGRLADRIKALRMECERGLAGATLQEAFHLLDHNEPEEAEELLLKLLGEELFIKFGAKLQQLKLCEESFFEL